MSIENNQLAVLSGSDLLKEAARIKEFHGTKEYDLSSFIREVEIMLPLFQENPTLQQFVFERYIKNKIQGPALQVVRALGSNATWTQIKEELIKNFGVKESYHSLYHQAINMKNSNVSEYFKNLRDILDKLNSKYEFDTNKPQEFSPPINESIILKTFLNGIHPNLSSIIYSRNISTLREAYYVLEGTGILRQYDSRFSKYAYTRQQYQQQRNYNENGQNRTYQQKQTFQGQPSQNSYNNSPSPIRQNNNSNQSRQNFFTNNSQQSRRSQYLNRTFGHTNNGPTPMEIDHIENNSSEEVNFQCQAQKFVYR